MITERMIQRALSAEILLQEVTGVKVCIVYAAELGLHVHDGCGGFCCGYLSSTVKRLLPDRYRGDRPTIVLNENCYLPVRFTSADRLFFTSVVAHEGSHAVEQWADGVPSFEPVSQPKYIADIQSQVELPPQEWAGHKSPVVRWIGHDDRFLRSLAHIKYRMDARCSPVDASIAWPENYYGLSSLEAYSETLADELIDREGDDIGTILRTNPPSSFSELWHRDSLPGRALMLSAGSID